MKFDEIKKTIETFLNDPKAAEMFEGYDKSDKKAAFVEVANKLGYELAEADIEEYIKYSEEEAKQRTEDAITVISNLPDDDLDTVAGGKGREDCRSTFEHMENCYLVDGCNELFFYYNGYIIKEDKTGGKRK